jgi:hypothetical protein
LFLELHITTAERCDYVRLADNRLVDFNAPAELA